MDLANSRILITGGCGFIGRALIRRLQGHHGGVAIRVLDNFVVGSQEDLAAVCRFEQHATPSPVPAGSVELIEADIRDHESVQACANGVDAIVHLAANTGVGPSVEDPRLDMESNVAGTLNVLEGARFEGVPRVVFASSGAPAGEVEPPIHEELPPHPVSPYGASKLAGEGYCSAYYRTFGIETVCLRFGNVYGPGSGKKTSVVAKFIRQSMNGEPCELYGDGTQTRDFIYVDDLIQAVELGIQRPVGGETFQIATGMECTVGEVAEMIREALHRRGITMEITHGEPRLGDVNRNYSDTRKAERLLGWRGEVELRNGIERTVDAFVTNRT